MKNKNIYIIIIITVSLLLVMLIAVIPIIKREHKRLILNEQARWIARYIGSNEYDFDSAATALKKDKPCPLLDFNIWYPVVSDMKNGKDDDIIVGCQKEVSGEFPTIQRDLGIFWSAHKPKKLNTRNIEPKYVGDSAIASPPNP